ncbi:MAG: hypothetical protein Q8L09_01650 [Candidatus Moranbacteria bacterium]|nr:hypothetical protein [Candidatus Moranbacteria bacterium]
MALAISEFLKGNIGKVLAEMISRKKESAPIGGFPLIKISFSQPASGMIAVMSGSDFPGIKGLEKDQKIYIYQET